MRHLRCNVSRDQRAPSTLIVFAPHSIVSVHLLSSGSPRYHCVFQPIMIRIFAARAIGSAHEVSEFLRVIHPPVHRFFLKKFGKFRPPFPLLFLHPDSEILTLS